MARETGDQDALRIMHQKAAATLRRRNALRREQRADAAEKARKEEADAEEWYAEKRKLLALEQLALAEKANEHIVPIDDSPMGERNISLMW